MMTPPSYLAQLLKHPDTVIFVGAGLSTWSGLPSWVGIIQELETFLESQGLSSQLVERERKRNDLLQAASYGVNLLTKSQFAAFIRKAVRWGSAQPHEVHRVVATLGPTCFVTTNYDQLLEEALRRWRPDCAFSVATNAHFTEVADIVRATAREFVFKPHGDVGDSASVILTREQYRVLYGEKAQVLHALNTLLISRPVLFVGYSLRDPDFLFVKDALAMTYRGGASDHFAIVPDVLPDEASYWRTNYGVHLVPYATAVSHDGRRDHSAFLALLSSLLATNPAPATPAIRSSVSLDDADSLLLLAKHAARQMHDTPAAPSYLVPLRVNVSYGDGERRASNLLALDGLPVDGFLSRVDRSTVLTGPPGAGKTFALRTASGSVAKQLHNSVLSDSPAPPTALVPILLDLRLYKGCLWQQAQDQLPTGLSLQSIVAAGRARFFIDAFNEIPREFIETASYEEDFAEFLARTSDCVAIISSRSADGLERFNLLAAELDRVEEAFVAEVLSGILPPDELARRAVIELATRPLFFHLLAGSQSEARTIERPSDVHEALIARYSTAASVRFGSTLDLSEILAVLAYSAIDEGTEAIPIAVVRASVASALRHSGRSIDASDLLNWLLVEGFLFALPGNRVAFVHQQVTEYLAAKELARLYRNDADVINKTLTYTRWDQVLFLAIPYLDEKEAIAFMGAVVQTDLGLAIRATQYVEYQRAHVVTLLLNAVFSLADRDWAHESSIAFALQRMPVEKQHLDECRRIMDIGNLLGGAGAKLVVRCLGADARDEVFAAISSRPNDFNFCSSAGSAIAPFMDSSDVAWLRAWWNSAPIDREDDNEVAALSNGAASLLGHLSVEDIAKQFGSEELSLMDREVLADVLGAFREERDETAPVLATFVRRGYDEFIFPLYLVARWLKNEENCAFSWIDETLVEQVILLTSGDNERARWTIKLLQVLATLSEEVQKRLRATLASESSFPRLVAVACLPQQGNEVFEELASAIADNDLHALKMFAPLAASVDWSHRSDLLVALVRLPTEITLVVLNDLMVSLREGLCIELDDVNEWVARIAKKPSGAQQEEFWLRLRLGEFLAKATGPETRRRLVDMFNSGNRKTRRLLAEWVLRHFALLSTDDFVEEARAFLVEELKTRRSDRNDGMLIGRAATEAFVETSLLPLTSAETEPLRSNLRTALRTAGARHGRRYTKD